eukprot:GCRY01003962.1.p1 GENE.GCRY01003962.1~~GCRY01003962.1.p1  ORF type:complete len:187 (-),score=4.97 GCRY01003962.1:455-1015(-)
MHHFPPKHEKYCPFKAGNLDGTVIENEGGKKVAHDRALVRASVAEYKHKDHSEFSSSRSKHVLFVGRLSYETTEEELKYFFERIGQVSLCKIVKDIVTGASRGYGFVEFRSRRDCEAAYHKLNKQMLNGRTVLIDYLRCVLMKGWKPRRLGGGLGGNKHSGQLRFGGRDKRFISKKPSGSTRPNSS